MMETNTEPPAGIAPKQRSSATRYIALLVVTLLALGLVILLVVRPDQSEHGVVEEVLDTDQAGDVTVNLGHTQDATSRRDVEAKAGYRYRVVIVDEAREGTAGIARIGGLVTFVAGARKGEHLVVEVTRVKRSVAEAVIVRRLTDDGTLPETAAAPTVSQEEIDSALRHGPVEEGKLYRARIDETGSRGDGIARIDGMVVFVAGGKTGEEVVFRIDRLAERSASGFMVARIDEQQTREPDGPQLKDLKLSDKALAAASTKGPVEVGKLYRATIEDKGKKGDGVAKIDGLIVFVSGAELGDHAVFEVTELAERFARARLVGHAPAEVHASPPEPDAPPTAKPPVVRTDGPSADDVQPGATFEVEVTEKDRNHPETDGVARIDGLVVFVPGTQPGDHVRIRITERANRFAKAVVVE